MTNNDVITYTQDLFEQQILFHSIKRNDWCTFYGRQMADCGNMTILQRDKKVKLSLYVIKPHTIDGRLWKYDNFAT
jgi:hypothetical protein